MKKIYNYLFPVFFSMFAIVACDEENDEIIPMSYTDPVVTVTKVDPAEGYVGNQFTINGDDFGVRTADIEVFIGSQKAEVISCEDKAIVAKVPQSATDGKISVVVYGQRIDTELAFRVLGKPGVSAVTPLYGFPGDEIKFEGHDFTSKGAYYTLTFGSEDKAEITGTPTDKSFTAIVPATAVSGIMSLVMSEQTVDMASYPFTVLKHATITVPETPLSGFAGSRLTIEGTNLVQELLDKTAESELSPLKITFTSEKGEGEPVEASIDTESLAATSISLTVPSDLKAGEYNISVITPFETIKTQLAYTVLPKPEVEMVDPKRGYVGSKITISGKNFVSSADDIEVKFGETSAAEISIDAETGNNIIVTVPTMMEFGSKILTLIVQGIEIEMSDNGTFELLASPVISSVTTGNAFGNNVVQAGNTITITGTGFTNSTIAESIFNGQPLSDIQVVSDTEITATVSENSEAGEGTITLRFDGVDAVVVSTDKLNMLKAGSDITPYVLKNYKHEFRVIEGSDARQREWWKPQDWEVENVVADGKSVGVQYHNKKNEVTSLAMQTDWGFPKTMTNGKIWQVTTLPAGEYKVSVNVREINITGTAHVVVSEGESISNTEEVENSIAHVKLTSIGNSSTQSFALNKSSTVSIGFVSTITAAQRYVKIESFKVELMK